MGEKNSAKICPAQVATRGKPSDLFKRYGHINCGSFAL